MHIYRLTNWTWLRFDHLLVRSKTGSGYIANPQLDSYQTVKNKGHTILEPPNTQSAPDRPRPRVGHGWTPRGQPMNLVFVILLAMRCYYYYLFIYARPATCHRGPRPVLLAHIHRIRTARGEAVRVVCRVALMSYDHYKIFNYFTLIRNREIPNILYWLLFKYIWTRYNSL